MVLVVLFSANEIERSPREGALVGEVAKDQLTDLRVIDHVIDSTLDLVLIHVASSQSLYLGLFGSGGVPGGVVVSYREAAAARSARKERKSSG